MEARALALEAAKRRIPTRGDIARWHGLVFRKIAPHPDYPGSFRQKDPKRPCLDQQVAVGGVPGSDSAHVLSDMAELFESIATAFAGIEADWNKLGDGVRLQQVATAIGTSVGAFIRIHPFINGNGRASRMLWRMLASRLNFPSFEDEIQRPAPPYGDIMRQSMLGDDGPAILMVIVALAGIRV